MRRAAAAALVALALGALTAGALRLDLPIRASLFFARRFWSANPATRLLNSPLFLTERDLGLAALAADRGVSLSCDVALAVPPGKDADAAEDARRRAGYILAPRRVALATAAAAPMDARPYVLRPIAGPPGCDARVSFP